MSDSDRFDSTSYGGQVEFEDEGAVAQVTNAIAPVKKFIPHIVAAIVIIIIAFFVYDFFIGSMVNVTITVKDTEGKLLNDNSLKVFAEGSTESTFKDSGTATYSVTLRPGKYRYDIISPSYVSKKSSFDLSSDNPEVIITLEKDIDVEILNFESGFPEKLFAGGTSSFTMDLKNHSDSTVSIDFVAEKDLEGFIQPNPVSIPANMTQTVTFQISVPSATEVKDEKNGDGKKAVIRVKYINEDAEAEFTLYPNPTEEITLSGVSLSAKARENQNKDDGTITIKNGNKFPIDDITISVEITSATKNRASDVLEWFQFTEVANSSNPQEIEISNMPAGASEKKQLQVIIPLTAKKEPDIKGNIVLNAPWLSEPIKKTLTLDVKEEAEYGLELSLNPRSPIDIEWDDTLGKYEDKMVNLRVKNTGQLELHGLVFSIANSIICSADWLILIENSIDVLRVGETKELKMNASSPIAMRGQESSKFCNIRYFYDNPVASGSTVEETMVSFVEVAPEPV